jgi:hypothetical protein
MRITRSLVTANTLILAGALVAVIVVGVPLSLADEQGHWLHLPVGMVIAAPGVTLAGTAWSGWLALSESPPRGFWSKALFALGIMLCLVELLWIIGVVLGIGAA